MHQRTQKERIYGRWVVVIDNSDTERFFERADAEEYKKFCNDNGMQAYVHLIESDSEDENFSYYFE